jgi:hypothetical protein
MPSFGKHAKDIVRCVSKASGNMKKTAHSMKDSACDTKNASVEKAYDIYEGTKKAVSEVADAIKDKGVVTKDKVSVDVDEIRDDSYCF